MSGSRLVILGALMLAACVAPAARFSSESSSCLAVSVSPQWADVKTEGTYLGYPHPSVIRSLGPIAPSVTGMTIEGQQVVTPSHVPAGLAMQLAVQLQDPAVGRSWVQEFFAKSPIGPETSDLDLLREGGIRFIQGSPTGRDADSVVKSVGSRALLVQIGPFDGALVHADPIDEAGTRPFLLVWSDGTIDSSMEGNTAADAMVEMAQSIYCS